MKMQYPESRGAGAYLASSNWRLVTPWAILWLLIVVECILWYQDSQILVNILFWTLAISIGLNTAYLGFESRVLAVFFKVNPSEMAGWHLKLLVITR